MYSISKTCYLSYDDNVYLNKSAEKLKVNSRVNKEYEIAQEEAKERLKIQSKYNKTADDDEILEALQHIPTNLGYDERLQINFAVIDHFEVEQKQYYWATG